MGKRISLIITLLFLIMATAVPAYGSVQISSERTTVINSLPDVTIYMDTDEDYGADEKNTTVLVNDEKTDISSVGKFKETGDGVNYYLLVDLSKSIEKEDFDAIKSAIIDFGKTLSAKDKVYLIPFGETVYVQETAYDPTGQEFQNAVNALNLNDDYTQLYNAIDSAREHAVSEKANAMLGRNIVIVFTDGADETTGGYISDEELAANMKSAGIPLYGFAVGLDKDGKERLGKLCRNLNGSMESVTKENLTEKLLSLKSVIDNTLTIKTSVRNSESIGLDFSVRVQQGKKQLLIKEGIKANKTAESKDVFLITVQKMVLQYWWILLIAAIAIIALIVLLVIRRNKGIVNIDGKVVYGSKVQRKYHVQVKEYNTKEIFFFVSVDGQKSTKQTVLMEESLLVGRSSINDLYFDDLSMSRQHFGIELDKGELYIQDLESTSGTYLNGVKVYGKQKLHRGDLIDAGKTQLRIDWK